MAGVVGVLVRFADQHLVVAQRRQVLGSAGVGGRAPVLVPFAGRGTGVLLALGQNALLPLVVLLLGEEVDEAVDVALGLVPQQEDTQAHLQSRRGGGNESLFGENIYIDLFGSFLFKNC